MGARSQSLLEMALQLPETDREEVAVRLLDSLEGDTTELSPDEWDAVWGEELERRLTAYRADPSRAQDWATVRRRLTAE